jgi:hypothetical protein
MSLAARASDGRVPAPTLAPLLRRARMELDVEVHGGSMVPGLPPGTRVRIACGATGWRRGDIVTIAVDPPISHRVVGTAVHRERRYVITRGDATWFCDLPVVEGDILGTVTAVGKDGEWGPPPPAVRRGLTRLLAWMSEYAVRAALCLDERLASRVVRAGGAIASRSRAHG